MAHRGSGGGGEVGVEGSLQEVRLCLLQSEILFKTLAADLRLRIRVAQEC